MFQVLDVRDPPPTGQCANTMAYIADVSSFSILVFDLSRNVSWRVQNKLFFPYPPYGTYTIAGESFDLMDGIFGMALSPPNQSGKTFPFPQQNQFGHHHHHNYRIFIFYYFNYLLMLKLTEICKNLSTLFCEETLTEKLYEYYLFF